MSNKTQTAIVLFSVAGLIVIVAMLLSCCATRPVYETPPVVRADINPCWPDPCPPCTNCIPPPEPPPPLNTNGLWIEVSGYHLTGPPDTNAEFAYFIVTRAHNLTNGLQYHWEESYDDPRAGNWIAVTRWFTATNSTDEHTNARADAVGYHFFRLVQRP